MTITQDFKCYIGLHKYKIYKEQYLYNPYNNVVGTIITCRCDNCGKLKEKPIYTDINYRRYTL